MWHTRDPKEFRYLTTKEAVVNFAPQFKKCPEECFGSAFREFKKNIQATKTKTQNKAFKEEIIRRYRELRETPGFVPGTKIELTKLDKEKIISNLVYPGLKFKKQREHTTQLEIRSLSLKIDREKGIRIFPEFFGRDNYIPIKTDLVSAGVADIPHSVTLCKRQGKFYFIFPHHKEQASVNPRVCALDPGVRTFLSGYDPQGVALDISPDQGILYRTKERIERLQARLSSEQNKKTIKWLKKEIRCLHWKIVNRVSDMHHKVSKMLAETYSKILLPKLSVRSLVAKEGRQIGPSTANMLLTLGHCKFRDLLSHKMKVRQGQLIECREDYTSKTCGHCLRLHPNLGKSKDFSCPYCFVEADRDANAARNILVMNYDLLRG